MLKVDSKKREVDSKLRKLDSILNELDSKSVASKRFTRTFLRKAGSARSIRTIAVPAF